MDGFMFEQKSVRSLASQLRQASDSLKLQADKELKQGISAATLWSLKEFEERNGMNSGWILSDLDTPYPLLTSAAGLRFTFSLSISSTNVLVKKIQPYSFIAEKENSFPFDVDLEPQFAMGQLGCAIALWVRLCQEKSLEPLVKMIFDTLEYSRQHYKLAGNVPMSTQTSAALAGLDVIAGQLAGTGISYSEALKIREELGKV